MIYGIIGAVVAGYGGTMFCQSYTASGKSFPLCKNANGGIPLGLIVFALVGFVVGWKLSE